MALKLEEWGTLGAYIKGDAPEQFEVFVKEQEVPPERREEFQKAWDYLIQWQKENPGVEMTFPTD